MKRAPPFVSCYRDRHGKVRWRFRRRGFPQAQTTLAFGSDEWWAWYKAATEGERTQIGAERSAPGTFNALIAAYYLSQDWRRKAEATRRTYRGEIERFRQAHGDKRVKHLQAAHIRKMMDRASGPAAANNLLRVMRSLMSFAKDRNWRPDNPAEHVQKIRYRSEGYHTWTEDEVARFEARWPIGTRQRLAFDLLLHTAQRSNDVRTMTRGQISAEGIAVRQKKTGAKIVIPINAQLAASLAATPGDQMLLLPTQAGPAFTSKGFQNWIKEAAQAAGLPRCAAHGLRKTSLTRLADAGCTANEIMAISGHTSLKEVERYTRQADQKRNARAAIAKLERTQHER